MAGFDLSLLGDKALERKLERLGRSGARRVLSKALRNSAKRVKQRIVENATGKVLHVRRGVLVAALKKGKIRIARAHRSKDIRLGYAWPTREQLGISEADKNFYPAAIEYGHGSVPAHPYIRPAVDEHKDQEFEAIRADVRKGILAEALRGSK